MYNQIMTFTRPSTKVPFYASSSREAAREVREVLRLELLDPAHVGQSVTFSPDRLTMTVVTGWATRRDCIEFRIMHFWVLHTFGHKVRDYYRQIGGKTTREFDHAERVYSARA